ncbi:organic hydroperoxide resistance protein [Demequina muriae]|uniref:Organic hydroperoxide resistance protein n=1 Tax=Demequina muriae TaxID=3051664 RepID=A0ABT8GK10_9MICO|nr:organic hydroperoxide resistance protein [Demequina sp. EGI L300058]MDN4481611.1 organic hydroperoxide resistance protein [Demequina sp. EGI L300058]
MTTTPKVFYTATATATGDGRNGHVATDDGLLDLDLATPKPFTKAKRTNPEQLFAAGYAACFNSAIGQAAKQLKVRVDDSTVTGKVGIGALGLTGGFGLAVTLEVHLVGVDDETARRVADKAHEVCPYSHATRGNIPVEVTVTTS